MKHKLTRILFSLNEWKSRKKVAFFGTSLYEKINPNRIPLIVISGLVSFFLFLLFQYIHYLSDFLYWFVGILEITKVLKIPFLDNMKYYEYLSVFVFFYLAISLLWDLSNLLTNWSTRIYIIRDEIWMIQKHGFGEKLTKFKYSPEETQVEWIHSGILNYLGLNRIFWKKGEKELARSPFFFPYGKNIPVLNKILKR
ncbi:hypothetical protein EHQ58_04425 [Leptospira ognonensis]|uniref:DUF304 domain-containing protein n=1 Tax=Leptospira ognonensis TaxID=2484945 RepID=A0A4R9K6H3_9LEPT|nr:hypothetical protein [Leptospira ognonensis]TGL61865.1 hypothetical protein EHQ58_04425 [Leptospira ognonensis]